MAILLGFVILGLPLGEASGLRWMTLLHQQ